MYVTSSMDFGYKFSLLFKRHWFFYSRFRLSVWSYNNKTNEDIIYLFQIILCCIMLLAPGVCILTLVLKAIGRTPSTAVTASQGDCLLWTMIMFWETLFAISSITVSYCFMQMPSDLKNKHWRCYHRYILTQISQQNINYKPLTFLSWLPKAGHNIELTNQSLRKSKM